MQEKRRSFGPAVRLCLWRLVCKSSGKSHSQSSASHCTALQGGIHPDFTGQDYLRILQAAKAGAPNIHVHAFSPLEVSQGAHTLGIPVLDFLQQLKAAGLGSLPGGSTSALLWAARSLTGCEAKGGLELLVRGWGGGRGRKGRAAWRASWTTLHAGPAEAVR